MAMMKIAREAMPALCARIAAEQSLILPVKTAGQTNFAAWEEGAEIDLCTLKTVKSAKDAFFPQSENLYTCKTEDKKITVTPEKLTDEHFVLFGIKACDLRGIEVLDKVFLSDPIDTFYAARRAHGTVVAMACAAPSESCFCHAFGIDPTAPAGADVVIWPVGESFMWQAQTEKGEALTALAGDLLAAAEAADETALEEARAFTKTVMTKLPYADLSLEGWGAGKTDEKFNSPVWDTLYKGCLACGTCTFVCPTCQCYDIKDYTTGAGVQRFRCWDSCMYSDFTMMAHGNNRTSQVQRFRQRFMHKLVYFPTNNDGMFSCVGCGRCVDKCPASLNIVKVIRAFEKAEKGETK